MNRKRISVAMATYNGEKYIREQIDSILVQLGEGDEIIISDDGSSDSTINIINSYEDSRIVVIQGPRNGIVKNFENSIINCTKEIIFLADQDDVWKNNKVEKVLEAFEDKSAILVMHDNEMTDECLNVINQSFFQFRGCKKGLINNLIKNSFIGCCCAFKKDLVKEMVPFPNNIPMHDQWIGLVASICGKVVFLNDRLMLYRRHGKNNSDFKRNTFFRMLIIRKNLLIDLLKYRFRRFFNGKN